MERASDKAAARTSPILLSVAERGNMGVVPEKGQALDAIKFQVFDLGIRDLHSHHLFYCTK